MIDAGLLSQRPLADSLTQLTGMLTQGQLIRQRKKGLYQEGAPGSPPWNPREKLDNAELPWMATGVSGPVQVMLANTIPSEGPAGSQRGGLCRSRR